MKLLSLTLSSALSAFLAASVAIAGPVAPADVVFSEGAVSASLSGQPGDVTNGAKIMKSKKLGNCIACHEVSALADAPFHGEVGPLLDGVADRWNQAELRGILANAKQTYDGTVMPAYYKVDGFTRPGKAYTGKAADGPLDPLLSAQQIEDVIAFLMTLKDG